MHLMNEKISKGGESYTATPLKCSSDKVGIYFVRKRKYPSEFCCKLQHASKETQSEKNFRSHVSKRLGWKYIPWDTVRTVVTDACSTWVEKFCKSEVKQKIVFRRKSWQSFTSRNSSLTKIFLYWEPLKNVFSGTLSSNSSLSYDCWRTLKQRYEEVFLFYNKSSSFWKKRKKNKLCFYAFL